MNELISVVILTYNEQENIGRVLNQLACFKDIIVIDSYSTDATLEIISNFPNVRVIQRNFDDHTSQWNYGISQVKTNWVLALDADYILSNDLINEINQLYVDSSCNGYFIRFKYCVFGEPLRGTILPPRLSLFKIDSGKYIVDGHTQLLDLYGNSSVLKSSIFHDDRKPLSRWIWAQDRYMILEAEKINNTTYSKLSVGDKIRKTKIFAPFIILFYCLFLKRGILDGWRGFYYAFQRTFAEILLSIRLIEISIDEN